jgi:penicillin-binding protein 1C
VALLLPALFIAWPLPPGLTDYRPVTSVRILDRNGGLLRELLSREDGRAVPIATAKMPPRLEAALIAAEDKGFYRHLGISPSAIARAAWADLKARRLVEGGSTITQQLGRLLVPRNRTLLGKLGEALWALRLEAHLSKAEILAQYLNRAPFGNQTFGVEAAAHLYFGRPASELSLAQIAALAAIPRGPAEYDPYRHADRLETRRRWVLSRLAELGLVPRAEAEHAMGEQLDLSAFRSAFRAPHAVEYIAQNLDRWGLSEATTVETTLDPELQRDAESIVREEVDALVGRKVSSGAALIVDNASGAVLAYVGSVGYFRDSIGGQNDGVQMHRQPGSSLKPFAYLEAFRDGLTPATLLADVQTTFAAPAGGYSPKNYDGLEHGPIRAREALANSDNVPAVRVAERLGPDRLLGALRNAGFSALDQSAAHYGLGLVLGDGAVSLWEEARAYSGLARGGRLLPLRLVRRATRADGTELPLTPEITPRRIADEAPVKLLTDVLSDNAARERSFGRDSALRLPFPAAAKTGTSKGYSDNWTAGFTHERTVAVWAGNFDGSPMVEVSGVTGAGPIFHRLLVRAMQGVTAAPLFDPSGLEEVRVCPLSGERAGPDCPGTILERFLPGTAPKETCHFHTHLAESLPPELDATCHALADDRGRLVDYGPEYYAWAVRSGVQKDAWRVPACAGHVPAQTQARIVSPSSGDEYRLFDDMPVADQTIPLQVRASLSEGPLTVAIDGTPVLELRPPFRAKLAATRGAHVLTVAKADGTSLGEVRYVVRER